MSSFSLKRLQSKRDRKRKKCNTCFAQGTSRIVRFRLQFSIEENCEDLCESASIDGNSAARASASSHLIRENIIERKNRRLKTEFFLNWEKNSSSHPTRHWFGTGLPGESGRLVPVAKNECKRGAMPGHPSCDAPKRHPRRSARNFRPSGKISKISPTDSSFPLQRRDLGVFGIKTQCSRRWWGASMQRAGRLAGGQNSRQRPDLIMGRRALARPSQKMARPPSEVAESIHSPHPPPPG